MENNFVLINKKKIYVKDWSLTIFQLCETIGIKIPRFCYHDKLSIAGNCRMCLIEVESSIKPIIACATSLSKGMSVLTNSALVKKARENVLEFLLINHPLDCPICDQGGECDLQDQSLIYGSDKGRFTEIKRSVEDKDFGPLVKTVMTRCIHCTRCVRYMDEIAGFGGLGTMGRGRDTEIGTYLGSILESEISGNVIDLCPVGALTSKPYAFTGRPWELTSVESIDILDSLCSNIRIDIKGSEIMRILPKKNELINEEWVTDKIRFSYDGLKIERLAFPLVKNHNTSSFTSCSWHFAYYFFYFKLQEFIVGCTNTSLSDSDNLDKLLKNLKDSIASNDRIISEIKQLNKSNSVHFYVGNLVDLNSTLLYRYLFDLIPCIGTFNTESTHFGSSDMRSHYFFNESLSDFEKSDLFLLINMNLQHTIPLLHTRIRKQLISNLNSKVLYCGINSKFNFDVVHFGLTNKSLLRFLKGKSPISSLITKHKKRSIVTRHNVDLVRNLSKFIGDRTVINNIFETPFEIGACELGIGNNKNYHLLKNNNNFIYLLNYNRSIDYVPKNGDFIVYQGHHADSNAMIADLILPSCSFTEENAPYINILGNLQWTRSAVEPIGLSVKTSTVLMKFIFLLTQHLNIPGYIVNKNTDKLTLYSYFSDKVPSLFSNQMHSTTNIDLMNNSCITSDWRFTYLGLVSCNNINYYETNIISLYSTTMRRLSNLLKVREKNFK